MKILSLFYLTYFHNVNMEIIFPYNYCFENTEVLKSITIDS